MHRYRIGTLAGDFYRELRKIDLTTTAAMAWELLIHPGRFTKDYLAGKRVGYVNPIKFFFYAFLVDTTVRSILIYLTGDKSFAGGLGGDGWFQITDLIATVFWGFLWALFYRKSGLNAAECAIAALLFQAEINFISSLFILLSAPLHLAGRNSVVVFGIVEKVVTAGYSYFFAYRLFDDRKAVVALKQTILLIVFFVLFLILMTGSIVVKQSWFPPVAP